MWYIEDGDLRMEIAKEGIIRLSMLEALDIEGY